MTGFAEDWRRTNHAENARQALHNAQGFYWDEDPQAVTLRLLQAQAEATLALVEQQRIANLMGLAAQAEPRLRAALFGEAMDALGVDRKAGL